MCKLLAVLFAASLVRAAVIEGSVVENQTGHPVSRVNVVLEPLPGSAASARTARTNRSGVFEFQNVPAGSYILTASRVGFAAIQYGQKRWNAAGSPITVTENATASLSLRLPHFAAISGSVLDENDVGLPDYEVLAYRDAHPPQAVARATADDRGVYRISGLPPGRYFIRSAAKQYDDQGYLPTFARESVTLDQSFPVQVEMEQQADRADIRPIAGRLFSFTITVATVPPDVAPVTITFASELGRQTVQGPSHTFGPFPAGTYEIYAQAPLDHRPGVQEDYRRIPLNRNDSVSIVTRETADTQFNFRGDPVDSSAIHVLARRNDLAGPGQVQDPKLDANRRAHLSPGPWQLALQPNAAFYVSGFQGTGPQQTSIPHPEGWNDVTIGSAGTANFTLSSNPGSMHGIVKSAGQPVAGAPVFLEPFDLDPSRRISQTFTTRTDVQGQFRFIGLAPGNYRILASFDYSEADSEVMTFARANPIRVQNSDIEQDLDLYTLP